MKFLIFGAGALGQALGCMLAASGHHVDCIVRPRFIEPFSSKGLKVSGIFGDFNAPPKNIFFYADVQEITPDKKYEFALITTKSYDTNNAVDALSPFSEQIQHIVSMQNGCGNIEIVEDCFGSEKTLGARVITGFEITKPGEVNITVSADDIHIGSSQSGSISQAAEILAEQISKSGHPTIAVDDIHQSLFAKLLYNCALNPLGAILGVPYGHLADQPETGQVMDRIIDETFEVIQALGGKTPWPDSDSYKKIFYTTLIPATYNHRASMLQDLENGKPTEVHALVGYVSSQGLTYGVPTPTCDTLRDLVLFKEKHSRKGQAQT